VPARIVSLRTAAIGRRPRFDLRALAPEAGSSLEAARQGSRPVWFGGRWHETAIYARLDLPVGAVVPGPAILEQPDATTVVDPGLVARVDVLGNVIMERAA
jgi:N-methylhydantoinase A